MPSRNTVKQFYSGHFYHVYNRGVAKNPIFLDRQDKIYFTHLLKRYLDPDDDSTMQNGLPYAKFYQEIELNCYCLMSNHFHLLIYVSDTKQGVSKFMQSIMVAYTMYFNKKYKRVGHLFQGVFKASRIVDESYLLYITRYIHRNPRTYKTYAFSSISNYLNRRNDQWLLPNRILDMFNNRYEQFLDEYTDLRSERQQLKDELVF